MAAEYQTVEWNNHLSEAARGLIRLAVLEDFGDECDWTSTSLVPETARGEAELVARQGGVVAGMPVVELVLDELNSQVELIDGVQDGASVDAGEVLGKLAGSARDILMAERIVLNFLSRLSGIATLTSQYVRAVAATSARIYDTRKTTPGWRLLEKYAVHCGGGYNHRLGLHRGVMIKDNHLACAGEEGLTLVDALQRVRSSLAQREASVEAFEVEVDTLQQLQDLLPARPDLVLLDNMSPPLLCEAVALRDRLAPEVGLEASGGVNLERVAEIAATGVDRISVGGLTHSARALDIGLDWTLEQP